MQAIQTKYFGPGNRRGSRFRAKCERGSIYLSYDYSRNSEGNHVAAARALIDRFVAEDFKKYGTPKDKNPWLLPFVSGGLPDGTMAHVFLTQ